MISLTKSFMYHAYYATQISNGIFLSVIGDTEMNHMVAKDRFVSKDI